MYIYGTMKRLAFVVVVVVVDFFNGCCYYFCADVVAVAWLNVILLFKFHLNNDNNNVTKTGTIIK